MAGDNRRDRLATRSLAYDLDFASRRCRILKTNWLDQKRIYTEIKGVTRDAQVVKLAPGTLLTPFLTPRKVGQERIAKLQCFLFNN